MIRLSMRADLIVANIGQLATCSFGGKPKRGAALSDAGLIENAAVAIANGRFAAVGTADAIAGEYSADEIIDAAGKVVCPGFVDPHTHIVYAGDRLDEFERKIEGADYLEILEKGGGIISTVRKTRETSFEQLVEQSRRRLDKMLACGTTTVEIKTGYGLDTETELRMLDVILELDRTHTVDVVPTFLAAHAIPPEFKENPNAYVDLICDEMLPAAYRRLLAFERPFFVDVFCERNAFDRDQSRKILETAKRLGFGIKAHVDEFTNLGGSRLAIELGAASVDHLDEISPEEIALLSCSETIAIVTPTVNFNFGSGNFADARNLIDSDCALALSTDFNPGSAPCPSQPMAMAIACRYQKLLPAEALNAATVNAAFAIGLGESHGSIETGKIADLLILDCTDYRDIAYEFGGNLVKNIVKNGKPIHAQPPAGGFRLEACGWIEK